MIKEKIIAPDMQTGLRMVKTRFGEEALILDSRVRRNRQKGSLKMSEEVEIIVGLDQGRSAPEQLRGLGDDGLLFEGPRPLADELTRLERVVEESPDHMKAHVQLAGVYFRLGRTEAAAREREAVKRIMAEQQARAADGVRGVVSDTIGAEQAAPE